MTEEMYFTWSSRWFEVHLNYSHYKEWVNPVWYTNVESVTCVYCENGWAVVNLYFLWSQETHYVFLHNDCVITYFYRSTCYFSRAKTPTWNKSYSYKVVITTTPNRCKVIKCLLNTTQGNRLEYWIFAFTVQFYVLISR